MYQLTEIEMQAIKDEPGQKPRLLNEQEKSAAKTKLENTSPIKANAGVIKAGEGLTARQANMTNRLYVHEVFLADNIYKKKQCPSNRRFSIIC